MALDAGSWRWSSVPVWVQALGALLICSPAISAISPCAKEQLRGGGSEGAEGARPEDREHRPYRYVRHPLYAAAVLYFLGHAAAAGLVAGARAGAALIGAVRVPRGDGGAPALSRARRLRRLRPAGALATGAVGLVSRSGSTRAAV